MLGKVPEELGEVREVGEVRGGCFADVSTSSNLPKPPQPPPSSSGELTGNPFAF